MWQVDEGVQETKFVHGLYFYKTIQYKKLLR